jgi:4-amino-4-deoxy-L-arabinose transferase-like glycosyltransferase
LLRQGENSSSEAESESGPRGPGNSEWSRAFAVILLMVLSAAIYLGNASFPALLDHADASHAMVSREMLRRHDWVIPYMNGVRYLMKAPLYYWAVAISYAMLGQKRVFLFVSSEQRAAAETFLLAESGGKAVYANRPATSVAASQHMP